MRLPAEGRRRARLQVLAVLAALAWPLTGTPQTPAAAPTSPTAAKAPAASAAFLAPQPAALRYRVDLRKGDAHTSANGTLRWEVDNDRYSLRVDISLLIFSRTQTSVGTVTAEGLRPERFGERTRSERSAQFDYAAQRVRFSAKSADAPLRPGTQDRASLLLHLAGLFNRPATAPARGSELRIPVVGARDLQEWVIAVLGRETLALPNGPLEALHLRRQARFEHDQTVDIWLAPSIGYLPARVRIAEPDGDVADQLLLVGR